MLRTGSLPCVLPPLPRWDRRGRVSLACPSTAAFPVQLVGRLPHRTLSRPARCSLALRPAWPAGPREGPFPEVLQTIRHLLIRPGCFRLERELPGGTCTHGTSASSQGTQLKDVEHDPKVIGDTPAHLVLPWIHRVFANAKRWALGVYHGLREEHLQAYLDEFVFRFDRRRDPVAAFDRLLGLSLTLEPATYQMLTGRS